MENQFDTDEQLRNALRDFEEIPDDGSFDAILEKMTRKKRRRFFIIIFWTGLIALSGIALPLLFKFHDRESISAAHNTNAGALTPAQHEADTLPRAVGTVSGESIDRLPVSSAVKTGFPETTTPERQAGPAGSYHAQSDIPEVTSSSTVQHFPSKKLPVQGDKQYGAAAATDTGLYQEQTSVPASSSLSSAGSHSRFASDYAASAPPVYEVMYMKVIHIPLPEDSNRQDISASLCEVSYPARFIAPEKKHSYSFYLGAQASPQLNGFAFSKNPNRDGHYNTTEIDFSDFYLHTKRQQRNFNFSLPFGVKAGVQINGKYEILAGFGMQSFREKEKLYALSPTTITPTVNPSTAYHSGADLSIPHTNNFRYLYYSLEANRLFQTGKAMGFKLGLGLYGNRSVKSGYVYVNSANNYGSTFTGPENLSSWLLTAKVKAGVIFNANRRLQLHISPGVFYSPTSVFNKTYVIRQKPYGVDIECLLLFRLFKIPGT